MSHRPLVFVSGLTVGDYLLWNWSLNSNHDVIALASGLTLPPLALAALWLLALSVARLVAGIARRPVARHGVGNGMARGPGARPSSDTVAVEESPARTAAGASSRKIAA